MRRARGQWIASPAITLPVSHCARRRPRRSACSCHAPARTSGVDGGCAQCRSRALTSWPSSNVRLDQLLTLTTQSCRRSLRLSRRCSCDTSSARHIACGARSDRTHHHLRSGAPEVRSDDHRPTPHGSRTSGFQSDPRLSASLVLRTSDGRWRRSTTPTVTSKWSSR
jgi:hypothetical protein